MGCAQSKVDNEESVSRCKERKILMKDAVATRNAFASGYSGYAISLKNTGAALSDYAHGEAENSQLPHPPLDSVPPPPPPPSSSIESLPPPPPPLPNFSPSPIKRAVSMPEMPMKQIRDIDPIAIVEEDEEEEELELDRTAKSRGYKSKDSGGSKDPHCMNVGVTCLPENQQIVPPMPEAKGMAWDYFFLVDNLPGPSLEPDEDATRNDIAFRNVESVRFDGVETGSGADGVEPKTPEKPEAKLAVSPEEEELEEEKDGRKGKQIEHSKTAPAEFRMVGNESSVPSVSLMHFLKVIDDHFLKASETAQDVCKMLEATRLHYHSNFVDNRGINCD